MATTYPFLYNRQIERYLGQFGRVLSGFQIEDGVERNSTKNTRRVNVVYASVSRIIGQMMNKRDSFSNSSIPMISFYLSGLEKDMLNTKNSRHIDHVSYTTAGGQNTSFERTMGPAYNMMVDVNILASSNSELYSILEQVLLVFNPRVAIQIDNSVLNSDYITEIFLESINNEVNYPTGSDRQVVQQSLRFRIPIRLAYPLDTDAPIIQTITERIFADSEGGIESMVYENVIDGDD